MVLVRQLFLPLGKERLGIHKDFSVLQKTALAESIKTNTDYIVVLQIGTVPLPYLLSKYHLSDIFIIHNK